MQSPEHDEDLIEWFITTHSESEIARLLLLWQSTYALNEGAVIKRRVGGSGPIPDTRDNAVTVCAVAGKR